MQSMELSLVIFTVLSQVAIGMTFMRALGTVSGPDEGDAKKEWQMVAGLMVVGMIASLFHLGHPEGAINAIAHLNKAWLSREVLFAGAFAGLAVLAAVLSGSEGKPVFAWGGVVLGLGLILSAGMTYAPPALPAVNNALPALFFLISAVMLGAGFASWFAGEARQPMLARVFTSAAVVGLVLYLAAPCIWLSGSTVMRMTAEAWLGSGFYWAHIGVLIVSLGVIWKTRTIPVWLPVLALAGELLGRAGFFADTIHTAANMGGLY
ncbi:DMSO reductase anchor subunit (DmsC) [Pseudodesulfovibrio profundus]|uniref:DMSO reductase anchor subunit (DmsC) n=1 Tax=Pseudodesulfovibrio profundus TaxID=57320 RepID=A0A2C8FES9_9BACT|nr:DmsC/YnfH family molybdoenzyme membrane anchor subunit [Pseudodesulfovibrio profundus]SOB60408.1 DMSO reductase anchor subunit (DmsC) [Pseudodesulfovibrio profundus]